MDGVNLSSDIKRGEIYYISRGWNTEIGSEQQSDRPAIIVSNDMNNNCSNVVCVVYMTTQPKKDLPTHVTIRSTGRESTALCEQVHSVDISRVRNYIAQCSDREMKNIDNALTVSLALNKKGRTAKLYEDSFASINEEKAKMQEELKSLKQELSEKENAEKDMVSSSQLIRAETERDTYKALYEQLLGKIVS